MDIVKEFIDKMGIEEFEQSKDVIKENEGDDVIYNWDGSEYNENE